MTTKTMLREITLISEQLQAKQEVEVMLERSR